MVTTPWCSEVTGSSRCSCGIYNCVKELCKLLLGEKKYIFTLTEKETCFRSTANTSMSSFMHFTAFLQFVLVLF